MFGDLESVEVTEIRALRRAITASVKARAATV